MSNKCIVNKLNGTLPNGSLPRLGCVRIHAVKLDSVPHSNCVRMTISANGQTISVTGNGYFSTTYEGLIDPASRMTSVTISGTGIKTYYFVNDDYDVFITGKYSELAKIGLGTGSTVYNLYTLLHVDTEEFKYDSGLELFAASYNSNISGKASDIIHDGITDIQLIDTKVVAMLSDFSDCILLNTLHLPSVVEKDEIYDFVTSQVNAGRTTCSSLSIKNIQNAATFRGMEITCEENTSSFLTWDTSSKITLYMQASTIADCTRIYAYGATAEEIAAWEQAGKTVVVVD